MRLDFYPFGHNAAHRGERNSPEYLPDCLQALAQVRHQDPADVVERAFANARALLLIG